SPRTDTSAAPAARTEAPADNATAKSTAKATESTTPAPATDGTKLATAPTGDAATVEKFRDQLSAGKYDRILGGKKERTAVEAFYASRDFAPLWLTDGAMSDRAKAAATFLPHVAADGLDPNDYPLPQIKAGMEPDALAEAEIKFTDAVLTFARHAMAGRVHSSRVAPDIIYDLARPDPANVLTRVAKAQDVG